jgi:hypothetical protein
MPSLVFFGYVLATMPRNEGGYYYPSTEYSPLFELVFGISVLVFFFFAFPIILLISQWWYMIPYFTVSYGLLYLYWRRCKQRASSSG